MPKGHLAFQRATFDEILMICVSKKRSVSPSGVMRVLEQISTTMTALVGVKRSLVQCPETTLYLGGLSVSFFGGGRCGYIFNFFKGCPFLRGPVCFFRREKS